MKQQASSGPLDELVRQIRDETGNLVSPSRLPFLEGTAARRARIRGLPDLAAYVQALAAGELPEEWGFLVSLVTIKESYFFRAPQQFEAIRREVLPPLLRSRSGERRLRIWSAACARGEEPASLAIQLAEDPALAGWDWSILATDLDDEALAGARSGLYGERAVVQLPAELLARYFVPRGKLFELSAEVRERIQYRPLNLARPPFAPAGAPFDLILLRNVLIYFRRSLQRRVVAQVEELLAEDGFLFLGATETLWPAPGALAPVELGGCFVYRHGRHERQGDHRPGSDEVREERAPPPAPAPPAAPAPQVSPRPPAVPLPAQASERVPAARAFEGLPPAPPISLAVAVLSLAEDRLPEAEAQLASILAQTPSDPQGHAVQGFLLDVRGDETGAIAAYRAALYLEPALFQVRLLLAECLLRRQERTAAERQFREVLTLLASGRGRDLAAFATLPVPDRERAERRSRQALGGS